MVFIEDFRFFNAVEESKESDILHNTKGSLLILQVEGNSDDFEIKVEGSVDNESNEFFDIGVINNETFAVSNKIVEKGIYSIAIDGYSRIRLDLASINNGYVSAFGKLGE